ncbi:MAG: hypothetical protein DYG89_24680 [Caldilinea sp. CFX5]|nr:hypothetical protein [Caldilinea sp. CFX5]
MNNGRQWQGQWRWAERDRYERWALIAAGVGILLCLLGLFVDPAQFFRSYLFAYLFWLSMALGCLAIVMMHYLTGGDWGLVLRRPMEAGALTLPLLAILFVPLLFGLRTLYPWAQPAVVAADELLQHKQPYLNIPFFLVRAVIYFMAWCGLAFWLRRGSIRLDQTGDPWLVKRLQKVSAGGLALFGLTVTFALIDWLMSLEPHWYSTIYGAMVATGAVLQAFAFGIIVVCLLAERPPLAAVVTPRVFNDLGSLLFAFVMLWAYMAFSQFLLIWAGNLPEEIPWYVRRLAGGWQWVALAIVLFHFALPFVLLLSREVKRNARLVLGIAVLVVVTRLLDTFWLVAPDFGERGPLHWLDIATVIAIGGLWYALFRWLLARQPLLPVHNPRLEELEEEAEGDHAVQSTR